VEGLKDYAMVYTDQGRLITRQTLKNLEDILPDQEFIRIHRSYIVPIHRLDSWTTYSVNIKENEIPVGRTYRKSIQRLLENLSRDDQGR
jgi:DNA-binding LytR/AlgR family response regulator